jgi:hypothetical protein
MSPIEHVEKLADEVFGYATAVSVDTSYERECPKAPDVVVRIWYRSGLLAMQGEPGTRREALAAMRERLERRLFLGEE